MAHAHQQAAYVYQRNNAISWRINNSIGGISVTGAGVSLAYRWRRVRKAIIRRPKKLWRHQIKGDGIDQRRGKMAATLVAA